MQNLAEIKKMDPFLFSRRMSKRVVFRGVVNVADFRFVVCEWLGWFVGGLWMVWVVCG